MGVGKTSIARSIQEQFSMEVIDMDQLIEAESGTTIAEIFQEGGEECFRSMETELLRRLHGICAERNRYVISTGGGVVLRPENRSLLRQTGHVIWLRACASVICERVGGDPGRPLLANACTQEKVEQMLAARHEAYADCAHDTVCTDDLTPDVLARHIYELAARARKETECS